jgi:hypothetical protein
MHYLGEVKGSEEERSRSRDAGIVAWETGRHGDARRERQIQFGLPNDRYGLNCESSHLALQTLSSVMVSSS